MKSTIEALAWVAKLYTNPGDTEMEQILGAMKTHTDYYLDGRGRIVAMRQNMTFPPLLSVLMDSEKNYQVTSWWRLNYTGKPTFTLHVHAAKYTRFDADFSVFRHFNGCRTQARCALGTGAGLARFGI
jgi:hypothetical protein